MNLDRWGAGALIFGALAYIALMAAHPTHAGGHAILGPFSLSALVHGTGLFVTPLLSFGFVVLAMRLGLSRPLPAVGLSFYLFGAVFVMLAATMSGFIIPAIMQAGHVHAAPGEVVDTEALRAQLQAAANYTVWLNRAFAQIYVTMFSIAILLFALAWPRTGAGGWIVSALGVLIGAGVLAWQQSGTLAMEAQAGALHVTLAHSVWILAAAPLLLHKRA